MLKFLVIVLISLVAAIPVTAIYVGVLTALQPLLDKLRFALHTDLAAKSHRI